MRLEGDETDLAERWNELVERRNKRVVLRMLDDLDAAGKQEIIDGYENQLELIQIAALVALMPCSEPEPAYDVVKQLSGPSGERLFPDSSMYRAMKALAESGHLFATEIDGQTGPRAAYLVTLKGHQAVEAWLKKKPARLPFTVAADAHVRALLAGQSCGEDLIASLEEGLDEVVFQKKELEVTAHAAARRGEYETVVELAYGLEKARLDACERWFTEVVAILKHDERGSRIATAGARNKKSSRAEKARRPARRRQA